MTDNNFYITNNSTGAVPLAQIPCLDYAAFYREVCALLEREECHITHYFALPQNNALRFYCLLLDDAAGQVLIASHEMDYYAEDPLPSITALHAQAHPFERDITERFGIRFEGMPWNKPLRFPAERADRKRGIPEYPFYTIEGQSLHEVNVGPIHAGIIEPGAFRFICNGEQVLHLEIALGYQHRSIEPLFGQTDNRLRQVLLAESVAGDSSIAHATAFTEAIEKLSGQACPSPLAAQRAVALELERMAMQIADTGALCMDVAYQLGQVACEALRTMTINTTQAWCGNRFGKGLIRPGGTNHPLTSEMAETVLRNVTEIARRYMQVREDIKSSPTLLARFEQCGIVPRAEMLRIGGVGQAARASALRRDIRASHPWGTYEGLGHEPIVRTQGDVMARLAVRANEIQQSATYIGRLLDECLADCPAPDYTAPLAPESLAFGLVEGWRGETCHVVLTDAGGGIAACRIKDPSLHNWLALALAVRGEGISDFPICNKSFNLSYCGHDL